MNVENITAELRPRSNWEAADLGAVLTRRDYGAILLRQAILIFPLWALLVFVFSANPGWVLFFLWYLKPLYERVALFYQSRSLFGDKPSVKETVVAAPRLLLRNLFMGLVVTRFSVSRSAFQPVNQLEGLRWGAYSRRIKELRQYASGGGVTTVLAVLEIVVVLGLMALVTLLLPFTSVIDWKELALTLLRFEASTIPADAFWMINVLYGTAVFLLTPFYAGAGFGIYINARSLLEGWDIELALRRLGKRLTSGGAEEESAIAKAGGKAAVVALFCVAGLFGGAVTNRALAAEDDPGKAIGEVLASPEFEIHKTKRMVPKFKAKDINLLGKPKLSSGGSIFGTVLFYSLIGLGCAGLLWLIWHNRHLFAGGRFRGGAGPTKARTVMGMEVDAESLPKDIPAAATEAWEKGEIHTAVSLLYRGALCWIVECGHVRIRESDTENDCLGRVRKSLRDPGRQSFFTEVTDHWILQAYGDMPPSEEAFRSVCTRWPFSLDQAIEAPPSPTNLRPQPTG